MIKHVLKSGEEVGTVAGKVIRADKYPTIYAVVGAIKEREQNVREVRSKSLAGTER